MSDRKFQIQEKKLTLQRRGQNLSAAKFAIGVILLGALGFTLDLTSFFYTKSSDIRTYLAAHRILLQETDLNKRLGHIAFLQEISGTDIEYLTKLEAQTHAEIEEAKRTREEEQKSQERKLAESQRADKEEIQRAIDAEQRAKAAAERARQETQTLRAAAQKSYDKALQDAYPNRDLFELKREGYLIP